MSVFKISEFIKGGTGEVRLAAEGGVGEERLAAEAGVDEARPVAEDGSGEVRPGAEDVGAGARRVERIRGLDEEVVVVAALRIADAALRRRAEARI